MVVLGLAYTGSFMYTGVCRVRQPSRYLLNILSPTILFVFKCIIDWADGAKWRIDYNSQILTLTSFL